VIKDISHLQKRKILEFIRISKTDRYDDFDIKDPIPFIMYFVDYVSKMIKQRSFSPAPHDSLKGVWE